MAAYEAPNAHDYPAPTVRNAGRPFTIAAFVCAGVALLLVPPVLAVAGVVLGIIGHTKGDRLARWAIAASIAGGIIGMLLGAAIVNARNDDAGFFFLFG